MFKKLFLVLFYIFLMQTSSQAYLDPGTGGIILQAIIGFIAAIGATATIYWRKLKNGLSKFFKKKKKKLIS